MLYMQKGIFQALFARSGALWLGLPSPSEPCAHFPASQVEEKAVLAYMVFLEVVVGLLHVAAASRKSSEVLYCEPACTGREVWENVGIHYSWSRNARPSSTRCFYRRNRGCQLREILTISNFG